MKQKRTALGVHIFAGGFTCGIKQAGFEVLGHLEDGTYGVESARLNWPDLSIWTAESEWPLKQLSHTRKQIDLVYCNPPCAIFSPSTGRDRNHWRSDPRENCWRQCVRVFYELRPRAFVIESVTQAWTSGRDLVTELMDSAMSVGYSAAAMKRDVSHSSKWTMAGRS